MQGSERPKQFSYAAMRIKTQLNNALYQLIAVCFEHELVIAEALEY